MMTATDTKFDDQLLSRLPEVRGRLIANADLGKQSWFRVGGPAEVLFKPADLEDLQNFLKQRPEDIPLTVLGVASNLIIRDGGIPGVTIRLLKDFTKIECLDDQHLKTGAGATDRSLAMAACKHGIGDLEFFSGIPGTIGGAVRMNAGCYGRETKDALVEASCLDRQGNLHTVTPDSLNMQYRHTDLPEDWIVTSAIFKGRPAAISDIEARLAEIRQKREEAQPIREKTGGSTFANPHPDSSWQLIDAAGCRGLSHGGAQISEKHCNFMINTGNASALDLEQLGEMVRKRVFDHAGTWLRWEIKRIGQFKEGQGVTPAENA